MAIPQIKEYVLSSPDLSASNIALWQLNADRSLLLVHDMQQYFINALPDNLRTELISNCKSLISHARRLDIPIVYSAQRGNMNVEERGLLQDFWGAGMASSQSHTNIVQELGPLREDFVVTKWRYSAFFATELADIFATKTRDQIIICGVYAHIGVLVTALDAYSRDIEVFLIKDAIADFSKEAHLMALTYAAECCASVLSTEEASNAF